MGKRGQVTIFIIIGIAIIGIGILIYAFLPQIKSIINPETQNPATFLQSCLENKIQETINTLSLQGGSISPENYYLYQDNKIEYLCYTNEYYKQCVVQQPMLKSHIESEIEKEIEPEINSCFNDLKNSFEDKGYEVIIRDGNTTVELLPEKVLVTLSNELILTRGDTKRYEVFRIGVNSDLYNLVGIARSIINWEALYGDSETTTYMNYYHNLNVEKLNQMDGSTIYILTNRDSGEKFEFASRSVAWPPGYGVI